LGNIPPVVLRDGFRRLAFCDAQGSSPSRKVGHPREIPELRVRKRAHCSCHETQERTKQFGLCLSKAPGEIPFFYALPFREPFNPDDEGPV